MDLGLKGKVALIAGGSTGLGKAVAMELAREGAKISICARDRTKLEAAAAHIKRETDGEVFTFSADLTDTADARAFVRSAIDHYGTADILVNNAGGPPSLPLMEIDDDLWQEAFRLNLMSTIAMTTEVIPTLKAKKWGRIINITSISVKQPIEGLILSNTIRSGVIGFAKTLSTELAPYQVTINSVCPGYTLTDRVTDLSKVLAERENTMPENIFNQWESAIPMGRLGTPEEFAAMVTFLASNRAGYITGAAIQIDGGWYRGIM
jgi:3-oxoacyl-[acyl-carrier protein] reductase